jgi:hypothetical protein
MDSAVAMRPWKPLPRSHWNRWISFRSVNETAESAFVVSLRPQKPNFFRHSCVLKTTFLRKICCWSFSRDSVISKKPRKLLSRSHWNRESRFRGFNETTESASAVSLKPPNPLQGSHWNLGSRHHFKRIYQISWQIWSRMENGFSPWIRVLGWVDRRKNRGSKIS